MAGKLYLCATPIGNLEDITYRVVRTLEEVDLIAAEDTRNSIKLLNHFAIKTPMTSYHEYNKIEKGKKLIFIGSLFIVIFIIWTVLIQKVDVRSIGAENTNVGFSTINYWFHKLTGVNMAIYVITDWLGLIPIFICMVFGVVGFAR